MQVACEHCKTKINIPDRKIPQGQRVRINCPKCKKAFSVAARRDVKVQKRPGGPSGPSDLNETGKFHLRFIESKPSREPQAQDQAYGYDEYTEDKDLEFFEDDARLALVMVDAPKQASKIESAVKGLGYKYITSPNTRDGIGKMRFHHFELVVLADGFDGQDLKNNSVMHYLNRLSMSIRRHIFLVLIGDQFKTRDNMMAFALSTNIVINPKELNKFSPILRNAISENLKFYKVYADCMVEMGKA
jgi:predicted Zn finger-like uncharacterized protein